MATPVEELQGRIASDPADIAAVRELSDVCAASDDFSALRRHLERGLDNLDDAAVAAIATAIAESVAARADKDDNPTLSAGLHLRAARLFGDAAAADGPAARSLAAAWRGMPDERISAQARRLLRDPSGPRAPRWLHLALSQVGSEATRRPSLRHLAAEAVDEARFVDARALYERLAELNDPAAQAGIAHVEAALGQRQAAIDAARDAAARATSEIARAAALSDLGELLLAAGQPNDAEEALRQAAIAGHSPAAEARLESILRDAGRLDALRDFWDELLGSVDTPRQVGLKRRLHRLVGEALGDPEGARVYLMARQEAQTSGGAPWEQVVDRAQALVAAGDALGAGQIIEAAIEQAPNKQAKVALLVALGRHYEDVIKDNQAAERAFRRVRVIDPGSLDGLKFYRRWYGEQGQPRRAWANLAQLHEALSPIDALPLRREVAREMASVAEDALKSVDKAVDSWRLVLTDLAATGDVAALTQEGADSPYHAIERLLSGGRRWRALVDHLESWLGRISEAMEGGAVEAEVGKRQQIALLFSLIDIYQDPTRLPLTHLVIATYQRIVNLDPAHPRALDGLAGGLEARQRWSELVNVLTSRVAVTEDPVELVELFGRIASLYLDQIQSEAQGIEVLEQILTLQPENLDVIQRLRELYRKRHDAQRLYTTYQRELPLLDGSARLDVLVELGELALDPLYVPADAIKWWSQVLALDPRDERARDALASLHAERSDWGAYVTLLEDRLAQARTRKQKVEVLVELGDVYYSRIGDEQQALATFTKIAELSPFNTAAQRFLQRLYVTRREWSALRALFAPREDWRGYAALLRDHADRTDDQTLASDIRFEVASALADLVGDPAGARLQLATALAATPERVDIAERLLTLSGEVGALDQRRLALATLAGHHTDPVRRLDAWRLTAASYDAQAPEPDTDADADAAVITTAHEAHADADTAADAADRSFAARAGVVRSSAALGALEGVEALLRAAQPGGHWMLVWDCLDDALDRLPPETTAQRVEIHRAMGHVAHDHLSQPGDAVSHFRNVVQLAPGDPEALALLEKIYFSESDFKGLEDVFKARADAAISPEDRTAPLMQLGELYEDVLVDGPRAAEIYVEVLDIAPNRADAREALTRTLEIDEAWDELAANLETILPRVNDTQQSGLIRLQLGDIYHHKLRDADSALGHLAEVIDAYGPGEHEDGGRDDGGEGEGAAASRDAALEGVQALFDDTTLAEFRGEAAKILEPLYRAQGSAEALVSVLRAQLRGAANDRIRAAALDEIAMLQASGLGDHDGALQTLHERFSLAPWDAELWAEMRRVAAEASGEPWAHLAAVWRDALDGDPDGPTAASADALAAVSGDHLKHQLRLALADVYESELIELDDAIAVTEVVESSASDAAQVMAALDRLARLYKKTADLPSFVRVSEAAAERATTRGARRGYRLAAVEALARALNQPDAAEAHLQTLLADNPHDVEVADRLLSLLSAEGAWERLDSELTAFIAAAEERSRRDRLLMERSLLLRDHLDQWELAIDGLIGLIPSPTRGLEARRTLLDIARAQESHDQRDVVLEALADHYSDVADFEGSLAVLLVRADFAAPGADRAACLHRAGDICLRSLAALDDANQATAGQDNDGRVDSPEEAERRDIASNAFGLYAQGLVETPDDRELLAALQDLAQQFDMWSELSDALSACADQAGMVPSSYRLWREHARVAEEIAADTDQAIASWRRALDVAHVAELDADTIVEALGALERLHIEAGDQPGQLAILHQKLAAFADSPDPLALTLGDMARLLDAMGRTDDAIDTATRALASSGSGEARGAARRTLDDLLGAAGRHGERVDLMSREAADEPDDAGKLRLLMGGFAIAENDLNDGERAVAVLESISAQWPENSAVLAERCRLYEALGRDDALAEALEARLALIADQGPGAESASEDITPSVADSPARLAILRRLGELYRGPLGAPAHAVHHYEQLLDAQPDDASALAAMEQMEASEALDEHGPWIRKVLADAYRRASQPAPLARVLEAMLTREDAEELGTTHAIHRELLALYRDELGDADQAWRHCRLALACGGLSAEDEEESRFEMLAQIDGAERLDDASASLWAAGGRLPTSAARVARRRDDLAALAEFDASAAQTVAIHRALLDDLPSDHAALAAVQAFAKETGAEDDVMDALERRLAASIEDGSSDERIARLMELGEAQRRRPDRQGAAATTYRAVLDLDPAHEAAFGWLTELYDDLGRHAELADLLIARLVIEDDHSKRRALSLRLAGLRHHELGDPGGAAETYAMMLDATPNTGGADADDADADADADALRGLEALWGEGKERKAIFRILEPLYQAREDWDRLVALYASTMEVEGETELQREALEKMARVELEELDRPGAAYGTLKALVDQMEAPGDHLATLESLADSQDRWDDLVAYYEARIASGRADGAFMRRLADVLALRRGDTKGALQYYKFAAERAPDDRGITAAYADALEQSGQHKELLRHLLRAAGTEQDPLEAAALRTRAAAVLAGPLKTPEQGIRLLEQVVDQHPQEMGAQESLATLLVQTGAHDKLHAHLRRWLELVETDDEAVALQIRLGRSMSQHAETARDGLTELEDVLRAAPKHPDVIIALEAILARGVETDLDSYVGDHVGDHTGDETLARVTADAAEILGQALGDDLTPAIEARVLAARLRVLPEGEERQDTLISLGQLLSNAGDYQAAFDVYSKAIAAEPGSASLEASLENLARDHSLWPRLIALYKACSEEPTALSERERYLLKLGTILRDAVGDPIAAAEWFERLLSSSPGSRDALKPLVKHYADTHDATNEARVLSQWLDHASPHDDTLQMRRRLAALLMDHLGDLLGAIRCLEGTLPEGARVPDVRHRLERLYVKTGRFDALVEMYDSGQRDEDDGEVRVELLAKMAQVYETRLGDYPAARQACQQLLLVAPNQRFGLTSLERIERHEEQWDAVDVIIEQRIEAAPNDAARLKLLVDRAELAAAHRDAPEAALQWLTEANALTGPGTGPNHLIGGLEHLLRHETVRAEAAALLARRYKVRKSWPNLLNALMIQQRAAEEPDVQAALAVQAADTAEHQMNDSAVALRVLVGAMKQQPRSMKLRRLASELAERSGGWAALAHGGQSILSTTDDSELVVELGRWLGEIQWHRLDDAAEAIGCFERVLEFAPGDEAATESLRALYRHAGDWRGLRALLETARANASDSEREAMDWELAALVAEHEGPSVAVPLLRSLLDAHPDNRDAIALLHEMLSDPIAGHAAAEVLEPVHRSREDWKALVRLYQTRAMLAEDRPKRAALWMSAAAVHETALEDPITAFKQFAKALYAMPDDRKALKEFERLGFRIGAWDELVRVLEEILPSLSDDSVRRDVRLHLAQIFETRLNKAVRARAHINAILAGSPTDRAALSGLARLQHSAGQVEGLAATTRRLAQMEADPGRARRLWNTLYQAAAARSADDAAGEMGALMGESAEAMFAADPGDVEAARRLLPHYEAAARYEEMATLIEEMARREEAPVALAKLKLKLARLRDDHLGEREQAIDALEEAWELDPSAPEVAERLESFYREGGQWQRLGDLLRRRLAGTTGTERRQLATNLAQIYANELRRPARAMALYEEIIESSADGDDPIDDVLDPLIALHANARSFPRLAELLVLKGRKAATPEEARSCQIKAAAVLLDQLNAADAADALLSSVLDAVPEHAEALLMRARLLAGRGDAAAAAETLETLAARVEGPRRMRVLIELVRLNAGPLDDAVAALAWAEQARSQSPSHPLLSRLLPDLYLRSARYHDLIALKADLWEKASAPSERAPLAMEIAGIARDHRGDDDQARLWLERAHEDAPNDLAAIEQRLALSPPAGTYPGDSAEVIRDWRGRRVQALALLNRRDALALAAYELGQSFEEAGDTEAAAENYRRSMEADGTLTDNLFSYGRLLVATEDWKNALKVHQSLQMQSQRIEDAGKRADIMHNLALASLELGQKGRAEQYIKRLQRMAPDHQGIAPVEARLK